MSNQKPISLSHFWQLWFCRSFSSTLIMPNDTYTQVRMQGPTPFITRAQTVLQEANGYRNTGDQGFLTTFTSIHAHPVTDWGTKWDVYDVSEIVVEQLPSHAGFAENSVLRCVWFTAWSPCIDGLIQISASHGVDFTIKYLDEGAFYTGFTTIIGGKINHEHVWKNDDVHAGIYHTFGFDFWLEYFFQDNPLEPSKLMELIEQEYLKPREKEHSAKFFNGLSSTELLIQ